MKRSLLLLAALLAAPAPIGAGPTPAGGGGERALLVVDPGNAESLHVANHYAEKRGVPARNILYFSPDASGYAELSQVNLEALLGETAARRIDDQVDFIVIPPGGSFFVSAPGLIQDPCFPVNRFSIGSAYALAFLRASIGAGGLEVGGVNQYYKLVWEPVPFSSSVAWLNGNPSGHPAAERYFIGAMLGYTGARGNTLAEILAMIDRSVAVDGTHPAGTSYYMRTSDPLRSPPRHFWFPLAVSEMLGIGGAAEQISANLPDGRHDCMGIMTGLASPSVDGADLTLLPGSFADHLTSFAGRFDTASQTKMSRWIAKGASGTSGTVEEPCNYAGKFVNARMHVIYRQGTTLGEAWLHSMQFRPYQSLLYGDPLTRPYGHPPDVDVPSPPTSPASGVVTVDATVAATAPGASIAAVDLVVDGDRALSAAAGEPFELDTTPLSDGWHELRALAYDDAPARNAGRWSGSIETQNFGLDATLGATPLQGDLVQRFDFTVGATGTPGVREIRLVQNERVVGALAAAAGTISVHGHNLGSGTVRVQAEALFLDGRTARSAPVTIVVDPPPAGTPAGLPPQAYGFVKRARASGAFVLELPASYDDDPATAVYTIVQPPAQASVLSSESGPYRILLPSPGACADSLTFRVQTPSGISAVETVSIQYGTPRVTPYGCGVNTAGSLTVLDGAPVLGGTLLLGIDDPTGAAPAGSRALLYRSASPHPNHPCGATLRSFYAGEALLQRSSALPTLDAGLWSGPGSPASVALPIPADCSLIGTRVYVQGALIAPSGAPHARFRARLTGAMELELGL